MTAEAPTVSDRLILAAGDQLTDVRWHGPAGGGPVRLGVRLAGDPHFLHQPEPSVGLEFYRYPSPRTWDQVILDAAIVGTGVHVDAAAGQPVRVDGTGQDAHVHTGEPGG